VADLIKLATDKEEQLVASSASDITKLIQAELQCQNRKQFGQWRMQDMLIAEAEALPEEEEETDFPTMTVNTKPKSNQGSIKAPGKHPYPLANNSSKKIPPRPC
jgi:hypothetical protein